MPQEDQQPKSFEGTIQGTVYRNAENGYSVLYVISGRNEHTVVGTFPELSAGEQLKFTGEWVEHRTYGPQFRCTSYEILKPTTLLGIERYLGGGLIRGVGPRTAKAIVRHFGEETLNILAEHPERLKEISGLGGKRWVEISESFQAQQENRQNLIFLQSYGIPDNLAVKISKYYKDQTRQIIQHDPYRLCRDLENVGFKTADRIGCAIGIPPDSPQRVQSALHYTLREQAEASGHVYLPRVQLCKATASLLQLPEQLCQDQLQVLILEKQLTQVVEEQEERIYFPSWLKAEKETASLLVALMRDAVANKYPHADRDISRFEQMHRIHFSAHQRQAITRAIQSGVCVITGGPGTGKTTIINCILTLLQDDYEIALCAPTGRAAKRMTEATGCESKTIHRLLEYNGQEGLFSRNKENPLDADCVIVDEASMIDLQLMRSLLLALDTGTRLILVGDADQLPSVGPGNVLGDILDSGVVPCERLTDIYRQSENSRIATNAHLINEGQMPVLNAKDTDFFFQRKGSFTEVAQTLVDLAARRLPAFLKFAPGEALSQSMQQIQLLSATKKGECGVLNLNILLQQALNPPAPGKRELILESRVFRVGDKVIQTRNNYDMEWSSLNGLEEGAGIFNGDMGLITGIDTEENSVTVCFDEDREVTYLSEDLADLDLAYCLSVHKSQGSEFPVVVMPVVSGPTLLLTRNLLYTALTRARKLVVLVGSEEVIRSMVQNDHVVHRYTALCMRLKRAATLPTSF